MLELFAQGDPGQVACEGLGATGASCSGGEAEAANIAVGVINILLFIVGVSAVVMLIIGGLRFITSAGDAQAAASAKNTVIYAVVGLVLALSAFAIVNFVLGDG